MVISRKPQSISLDLADFFAALRAQDIPANVREDARWRLIDTAGVSLAGSRMDFAPAVSGVIGSMGGTPEATVVGRGGRLPAAAAGFVNAAFAHGPDYDDTHSVAMVHIGCLAVPSAMAAAERTGASGEAMMVALVAGAEVGLRIGAAAPHRFHERGYHATGVAGPFVAATAMSRLLELDPAKTANAIGLAGSQAAGLLQGLHDGSWVKRLHPAWSVQAGLTAGLLAERGFIGPTLVFEGDWGLYSVLLHDDEGPVAPSEIVAGLGERWLLPDTTFKPYSCGAWNHSSMDAVRSIMRANELRHPDIARIDVFVPRECIPVVCEPRDAKVHPRTAYHMKFSLPSSVAILAVLGHADVDDYSDAVLANKDIADLALRVNCNEAPDMKPERFPARVVLTSRDGRSFEVAVPAQRGGPGNPMTADDHRAKFRSNARPSLGEERTEQALSAMESVWDQPGVDLITHLLVSAHPD